MKKISPSYLRVPRTVTWPPLCQMLLLPTYRPLYCNSTVPVLVVSCDTSKSSEGEIISEQRPISSDPPSLATIARRTHHIEHHHMPGFVWQKLRPSRCPGWTSSCLLFWKQQSKPVIGTQSGKDTPVYPGGVVEREAQIRSQHRENHP